jgi:hypothetical protein
MKTPLQLLDEIRIVAPCPIRWEAMTGSNQVRHCSECDQQVFDLSALTAAEAVALIQAKRGQLCIQLSRRPDGTVRTVDSTHGWSQRGFRWWQRLGSLAAALFFVAGCSSDADASKGEAARPATKPKARDCVRTGGKMAAVEWVKETGACRSPGR